MPSRWSSGCIFATTFPLRLRIGTVPKVAAGGEIPVSHDTPSFHVLHGHILLFALRPAVPRYPGIPGIPIPCIVQLLRERVRL